MKSRIKFKRKKVEIRSKEAGFGANTAKNEIENHAISKANKHRFKE